ncbi:MAG: hypothetical protein EPN30_08460 [Actinomycetota bacterium]|nr:MAG: hypothetical protein EPN30_08460 [Actinomycetota bacterium]
MGLGTRNPIYDALLLAHILSAVAGFGANALTGIYAGQLYPGASEEAVRYFNSPRFLAEKLIYLIPIFGLIMIGLSRGMPELEKPWVLIGMLLWIAAVAVAHAMVWPAERRLPELISRQRCNDELRLLAKKVSRGALVMDLIFVAAFVVMIVQIGGK